MRVVTAAALLLVAVAILVGCAEGRRKRGNVKPYDGSSYASYGTTKEPSNIAAALVGIYLPEFRAYGGCPPIMINWWRLSWWWRRLSWWDALKARERGATEAL